MPDPSARLFSGCQANKPLDSRRSLPRLPRGGSDLLGGRRRTSRTGAIARNHMPTRQERSAQSEANPANLKELPWRRLPRQSPPVTALNRCAAADGCRDRPLLAVILQEGNARPLSRGRPPPPDQTPLTLLSCNGISRYKPRCFATAAPVSSGSILSRHGATTQAAEISAPWQWCGVNEYSLMSAAQPMCRCSFTIDRVRLSLDSKAPI